MAPRSADAPGTEIEFARVIGVERPRRGQHTLERIVLDEADPPENSPHVHVERDVDKPKLWFAWREPPQIPAQNTDGNGSLLLANARKRVEVQARIMTSPAFPDIGRTARVLFGDASTQDRPTDVASLRRVISLTGIGDHDRPESAITLTGIRNSRPRTPPPSNERIR